MPCRLDSVRSFLEATSLALSLCFQHNVANLSVFMAVVVGCKMLSIQCSLPCYEVDGTFLKLLHTGKKTLGDSFDRRWVRYGMLSAQTWFS